VTAPDESRTPHRASLGEQHGDLNRGSVPIEVMVIEMAEMRRSRRVQSVAAHLR
jgi:hypothetical protein